MFGQRPYTGGQRSQPYQKGSYRPQNQQPTNQDSGYKGQQQQPTNHESGYKNQQPEQGKANLPNENVPKKSETANHNVPNKLPPHGNQSSEVKTCVVNPFIPLQVSLITFAKYIKKQQK